MLFDIIMESLMSMDDEALDAAIESMSDEELEIVNNYIDNAVSAATEDSQSESDDAYIDALEAAVYELNSMSEEDIAGILESLDEEIVEDLIAMEGIISNAAKLAGKASATAVNTAKNAAAGAKKGADAIKSGASDVANRVNLGASKAKDALTNKLNEAKLVAYQQTPTFRKGASIVGAAAKNTGKAISNDINTAKNAVKKSIDAIKADAAGAKGAFKSGYDSKANESAEEETSTSDIIASVREKILSQCK